MISAHLQSVCGLQAAEKSCRNARNLVGSCRAPHNPVVRGVHIPACDSRSGSSSISCRPSVRCSAESEAASGYTPADYISYSTDENKQCHHNAEVWVDAPFDVCYSRWHDWTKLLNYLDLVGQIGLDSGNPNMALFQCFYRFRKLPLMEIVFLLEREERQEEEFKAIHFKSVYGMPIKGQVQLSEQLNGQTRVRLYFTHPVPNLLVQLQIGPFGVETDLKTILQENLETYKQQAEAAAPADWEQQKQQVAVKVQKLAEELKVVSVQEVLQRQQEQQQQQEQQDQVQQQEEVQQEEAASNQQLQEQQQQPQQQVSQPADPQQEAGAAAGKPPRGRTAAKASSAAGTAGQQAGAAGRKTTRGRSVSKAAAAGGGDSSSSSNSSTAAKRRSRMSSSAAEAADTSSGNGTGPVPDSSAGGKGTGRRSTTRRSSKRPSTAAKE